MPSTPHTNDARVVADRLGWTLPDGRNLLHDVTLSFGRERTGLIGANGSGKTTLVRLLSGELRPSSGTVYRNGSVAVLPQDFRPPPDAPLATVLGIDERLAVLRRLELGKGTAADVEYIGDDWDLPERAAVVLARFGLAHLPLHRRVGALSGGEATRVAIASLTLGRPDFLLLDEPTNHLDAASREALYAFIAEWTGGLLCVSHDRTLLRRMDRIVELSRSGVRVYGGNYDVYRARRDADDAAAERAWSSARGALQKAEQKAREVRERQARREVQGHRGRAHSTLPKILLNARKAKAQATGGRVQAVTEREVEERRERVTAARQKVEERVLPRFDLPPVDLPAGRLVVELQGIVVRHPGSESPLLDRISLRVVGPERVAIVGPNGSGKTTLLEVIRGDRVPDAGRVRRLPDAEVMFLDQHGAGLDPGLSVLENFRAFHPEMEETAVRYALARFLFSHEAALQAVGTLSGGQRLRASLACILGGDRTPSLLVLDEPTNHLDLDAVQALETALRSYGGALLVVSHDAAFIEAVGVHRTIRLG